MHVHTLLARDSFSISKNGHEVQNMYILELTNQKNKPVFVLGEAVVNEYYQFGDSVWQLRNVVI